MLLPQSTAFATLRNRLTSVSSMGFIHLIPKASNSGTSGAMPASNSASALTSSSRSKGAGSFGGGHVNHHTEGPKFPELLSHFRMTQGRHERSRRQAVQALLRLNTYGNSSSGLAGAVHYNQQQQHFQQHQQKHQRKQQQQVEHQQLQQQVQHQQQLYDIAHNNHAHSGGESSVSRTYQQDGSFASPTELEHDSQTRGSIAGPGAQPANTITGTSRRRTRDRQSQQDASQRDTRSAVNRN